MKKSIKHIYIICILFLLMIGVTSVVSATEKNMTPEQFLNNISDGIAAGDVITISNGTANVSTCYTINVDNIIIKANGNVTFKGNHYDAYFLINGSNVTLRGITFTDFGTGVRNGGAIHWNGDFGTVDKCTFINCSCYQNGGAICWWGGNGTIAKNGTVANSTFIDCNTTGRHDVNKDGGAIAWYYAQNGLVYNCTFKHCTSHGPGGAVSWSNANYGKIYNCRFDNCSCPTTDGGAISWYGGRNSTILNCTFNNCSAKVGGAIRLQYTYSKDTVKNCTFINCKGTDTGAISWYNGSIGILENCKFYNCTTTASGGAIVWDNLTNGIIINSTFINCTSKVSAGAIIFRSESDNCKVINSKFEDCGSETGGAIVWNSKSDYGLIYNCSFTRCNSSKYGGGAVSFSEAEYGKIDKCTFNNCSNGENGGAVTWYNAVNGTISNSTFANCTSNEGGAVRWFADNGTIINCNFTSCNSSNIGGAICLTWANNGHIINCIFTNCSSTNGGSIFCEGGYNNRIINNTFNNNTASHNESIYNNGYSNLVSGGNGGIIYNNQTLVNNVNVTVLNNETITVVENQNINLTAVITTENYTVIGPNFLFNLTNNNTQVPGLINTYYFIKEYTVPTGLNKIVIGAYYDRAISNYKTATLIIKSVTVSGENLTIPYNKTITIKLNVTSDNTNINEGKVYITVNNTNYTADVTNGKAEITLPKMDSGIYELKAIYNGTGNYSKNSTIVILNITKIDTPVIINVSDITYGDNATVKINVYDEATGKIKIKIKNTEYTEDIVDGKVKFTISGLDVGTYEIIANYTGDKNFNNNTNKSTFKVTKIPVEYLNVTADDISYGENLTIVVKTKENITANLTININGTNYDAKLVNGECILEVSDLIAGKYNITATITDDKYEELSNKTEAVVKKINTSLNIAVKDVTYGENATISIKVDDRATGNITIKVDNKEYTETINNGEAIFTLSGLDVGEYKVVANYDGDNNFYNNTNSSTFKVTKMSIEYLNVTADDISYGENLTIVVKTKENITANLTISINGTNYDAKLVNGECILEVSDLIAGKYNITATITDDKYEELSNKTEAVVKKINTPLNIAAADVVYGENVTITINTDNRATGNITIKLNNTEHTKEIKDGKVEFTVSGLDVGEYKVVANYDGDNNFYNNTNSSTFKVAKATLEYLNVTAEDIYYGENLTVVIKTKENITANLTLKINNTIYNLKLIDGLCITEISGLIAGKYNITATVNHYEYKKITNNTEAVVKKINTPLNIVDDDIEYGENATIIIKVDDRATGNITIRIGNKEYTETINNGEAIFTLSGLDVGEYEVVANYDGDNNFYNNTNKSIFKVTKIPVKYLNITADDVFYGENLTVVVKTKENITANLTIIVNDTEYKAELVDGECILEIPNLPAGKYNVTATVTDDRYVELSNNTNATVKKIDTPLNITADDIKYGDNATIIISVDDRATGNITIIVNNTEYTQEIEDGKVEFTIPDLGAGEHEVIVNYDGDNNFNNNTNTSTLTVNKVNTPLNITVDDIKYGDNATIIISVDDRATGNITIIVNNTEYTQEIEDGKVEFTVPDLDVGEYKVVATYDGDNNFYNNTNSTKFNVTKATLEYLNVTADDVFYGENLTVIIKTKENITANLTVTINNTEYSVRLVNGECILKISDLTAGKYNITATITDDRYEKLSNSTIATVKKINTPLNITVKNITYGENETITIKVDSRATGNITIKINNIEYTKEIKDGIVEINLVKPNAGVYEVTATYNGDNNFNNTVNSTLFTVAKVDPEINVTVKPDVIIITIDKDATGNITVEINGTNYTGVIDDGVVIIPVPSLPDGEYNIFVVYNGDINYNMGTVDTILLIENGDNSSSKDNKSHSINSDITLKTGNPLLILEALLVLLTLTFRRRR